ncbi:MULTISPECIES: hypothetical protein [Streptomyces]|uniref:hypothetical protein n=1 Tax=Streptomyces TaxID=1883 RepID=UPI000A30D511|nr:hypothetical protein [Streptomyces sp. TOR3209]
MSESPVERGIKRLWRRPAHDHNKAGVSGDTPGNTEATPDNTPQTQRAQAAGAMPSVVFIPDTPGIAELATVLVTLVMWAAIAWWTRRSERWMS